MADPRTRKTDDAGDPVLGAGSPGVFLPDGVTVLAAGATGGLATCGVRAFLSAHRVQVEGEGYCTGADGLYRFAHETYEGTSTGDEALTGRFVLEIHTADNVTQGFLGLATGQARIYDAESGRLKLTAEVSAIDSPSIDPPGVKVDGFVKGHVLRDPGAPAGAGGPKLLFANFTVHLDTAANFVGNLGADEPIAPSNTAVLQDARTLVSPVPAASDSRKVKRP